MRGDFSRGTSPDGKRGRHYRRVLLQQGRVLLDSDHAATVDALQREDRDTLRHVACAHGSSDAGFLCTPGRLLALFETTEGVEIVSGAPRVFIDYRHRYLSRQPALYVEASGGAGATVRLPLRASAARLAVWARAEASTTLTIEGVSAALTAMSPPETFERAVFALGSATDVIEVTVPAGDAVWIALIESDVDAGDLPLFHAASGSYQVDGLRVHLREDSGFPEAAFPSGAGFWPTGSPPAAPPLEGLVPGSLASGDRLVAYVEAWERHLSAVEDPGLLERALGGSDTCTRTEALGQLKLARIAFATTGPEAVGLIQSAFRSVRVSGGTLTISHRQATSTTDPCALPELEGYTGTDNRLYRFEVHEGGALADVRLKWSRNNGAELFAADVDSTGRLLVPKDVPLADNDLVEVLSDVIDLGDERFAAVLATGFVPPERATGTLARLVEVETVSSNHRVFELVEPLDTSLSISMATVVRPRLGDLELSRLRLRRWDGIVDPRVNAGLGTVSQGPHDVEDGLQLTFSSTGSYEPGQYWQYEARAGDVNADSEVLLAPPHGPERLFAPLALFEYQGGIEPLKLLAWLDTRYPRLCTIRADDVAFDGARVESGSATVQAALEELFDRGPEIIQSSCGALIVRPENDLQACFDTIPAGGDAKVCIHPGLWTLSEPVVVEGKGNLVIEGAGRATRITAPDLDALLVFQGCRGVTIEGVSLRCGAQLVEKKGLEGVLSFSECGSVDVRDISVVCGAAPTRRAAAIRVFSESDPTANASVRVRDCDLEVGHGQTGILVVNAAAVDVRGNALRTPALPLDWARLVADPSVAAWLGRLLIDNVVMGETDEANSNLLVGSSEIVTTGRNGLDGRPRIIVHLEQWGHRFITFSTHPALGPAFWEPLLVANPIQTGGSTNVALEWIHANLRRLRSRLARWMYAGASSSPVNVPLGATRTTLLNLTPTLVSLGSLTTGGQGIVVGGRRSPTMGSVTGLHTSMVGAPPLQPDIRISDNRVEGFVQGIHLGASLGGSERTNRFRLYRAHVHRNTVFMRIPPIARERHGIFVGNAQNVQVLDNLVELEAPSPADAGSAPASDGIRVWGVAGPMLQITGNHIVGVTTGVRVVTINPQLLSQPGIVRSIRDNAYAGLGVAQVVSP